MDVSIPPCFQLMKHALDKQWYMWKLDGSNNICHQKNQILWISNTNITYSLNWTVICNTSVKKFANKILEVYFIVLLKLTFNKQIESDLMHFFINGITQFTFTLHVVIFSISPFIRHFISTDDEINSEKLLLLIILQNLFYSSQR